MLIDCSALSQFYGLIERRDRSSAYLIFLNALLAYLSVFIDFLEKLEFLALLTFLLADRF